MKKIFMWVLIVPLLAYCKDDIPTDIPSTYKVSTAFAISTDKAAYKPGETVKFSITKKIDGEVRVRYKHLNDVVEESPLTSLEWSWIPPVDDFRGYMVDLYSVDDKGQETIHTSIAVDVSSDPSRFPRNGFLSAYGSMSLKQINSVISNLNRHHINYVQYQDWHYKHHMPLAGTPSAPKMTWTDIINRECTYITVKGYIDATHRRGMKSLFYNLAYGALSDAAQDGVSEEWYIFKDAGHANKDYHPLGAPFKSNIYLLNPANPGWQRYIGDRTNDLYQVFDFDGYQIDQLGNRGTRYDYHGNKVDLVSTYKNFIQAMKKDQPEKSLVMNAVSQYGQEQIATAPVDFLYTEIWDDKSYAKAAQIIKDNDRMSGGKKTVLAAYVNYGLSGSEGFFNAPGVLFANAVFHAFGGAHLELGEHMLSHEYFPNSNLDMNDELKNSVVSYYDFITAYENLLRDGGNWKDINVTAESDEVRFNCWPPQKGNVATVGKQFDNREVIHFINFTNAVHLDWVDDKGTQPEPVVLEKVVVNIPVKGAVKKVWLASPDLNNGVSTTLSFIQTGNGIKITVPYLEYWDMLVVEY